MSIGGIWERVQFHKYICSMFLHPNNLSSASWNRAPVCNTPNLSPTQTGWFWGGNHSSWTWMLWRGEESLSHGISHERDTWVLLLSLLAPNQWPNERLQPFQGIYRLPRKHEDGLDVFWGNLRFLSNSHRINTRFSIQECLLSVANSSILRSYTGTYPHWFVQPPENNATPPRAIQRLTRCFLGENEVSGTFEQADH